MFSCNCYSLLSLTPKTNLSACPRNRQTGTLPTSTPGAGSRICRKRVSPTDCKNRLTGQSTNSHQCDQYLLEMKSIFMLRRTGFDGKLCQAIPVYIFRYIMYQIFLDYQFPSLAFIPVDFMATIYSFHNLGGIVLCLVLLCCVNCQSHQS